jgi:hypothetical protein
VHLQKSRAKPAVALFTLAQANLRDYPNMHHSLDVAKVLALIRHWQAKAETADEATPVWNVTDVPNLTLVERSDKGS